MRWLACPLLAAFFVNFGIAQVLPPIGDARVPVSQTTGIIRVVSSPDSGFAIPSFLTEVIQNKSFTNKAIAELSPEAAKSTDQPVRVRVQAVGLGNIGEVQPPGVGLMTISVSSFDKQLPAKKLFETVCRNLGSELSMLDTEHEADQTRQALYQRELGRLAQEISLKRQAYIQTAMAQKAQTNSELASQAEFRLNSQRETVDADLQGLGARREILEHQIAEIGKKVTGSASQDPIVVELEKAVGLRKQLVESLLLQFKNNITTQADVLTAESELAEHQAELARARREAAQAAGGQRLSELSRRLDDTAIEIAEESAKRDLLTRLHTDLLNNLKSSHVGLGRIEVELLEQQYREIYEERNRLARKMLIYQPPSVTIISVQEQMPAPAKPAE